MCTAPARHTKWPRATSRRSLTTRLVSAPSGRCWIPEHVYILDQAGNRVSVGTSGEMYVGGNLLARGYLNLPETTAKAFQDDPFQGTEPGARMYRTGDKARILPSGLLEITGRVGGMIKTRGYTVQPGAVETAIVKHLAVRNCAVVARGDGLEKQLVAYVVPDKGRAQRAERWWWWMNLATAPWRAERCPTTSPIT